MNSLHYDNEEMKLSLLIDHLNVDFSIESKADRIRIQKIVYLASELGYKINDDFKFSWYLNGPYCPALTRVYYSLRSKLCSGVYDFIDKDFDGDETVIDNIKQIIDSKPQGIKKMSDWLELVASILFLHKFFNSRELAIKYLKLDDNKKHLNIDQYSDSAYSILNKVYNLE